MRDHAPFFFLSLSLSFSNFSQLLILSLSFECVYVFHSHIIKAIVPLLAVAVCHTRICSTFLYFFFASSFHSAHKRYNKITIVIYSHCAQHTRQKNLFFFGSGFFVCCFEHRTPRLLPSLSSTPSLLWHTIGPTWMCERKREWLRQKGY